jgi:hypothetical protein
VVSCRGESEGNGESQGSLGGILKKAAQKTAGECRREFVRRRCRKSPRVVLDGEFLWGVPRGVAMGTVVGNGYGKSPCEVAVGRRCGELLWGLLSVCSLRLSGAR